MQQGWLLARMLVKLQLACLGTRTDEDSNSEIFSVTNWKACYDLYKQFNTASQTILDDSDISTIAKDWKNTVTVTFRGSVIIRYSWKSAVQWNDRMAVRILDASRVVCWIVKNIC